MLSNLLASSLTMHAPEWVLYMTKILFVYEWLNKRFFDISLELIVNRKIVQFFDAEKSK